MIEAEDEKKAEETLIKYWENKSEQFSESYSVYDVEVVQTLKQIYILK